jgi:TRAP transporter TAXI family solute receptor
MLNGIVGTVLAAAAMAIGAGLAPAAAQTTADPSPGIKWRWPFASALGTPAQSLAETQAQQRPLLLAQRPAPTAAASGESDVVAKINSWTVGLAGGLPEGTYLRFAAEIARNLNEGGELRVLPVVTPGATENVRDLLYLKGIDIAITATDVFEHFRTVEKIPNIDKRINYISSMYLSEIHILVRPEINSLADLAGKKVAMHTQGSGSTTSGPIIFKRLGIAIDGVFINNAEALERMKKGEILGLVHNAGKPNNLFTNFKNDQGFKFLEIPFDKFDDYYVPATLTEKDYPGYIKPGEKIETLAVPAVLAVYNWPRQHDRQRRVARFIDHYFDRFDRFKVAPYHPSWKTINLAANVPGWTRYWVADDKLKQVAARQAPPPAPTAVDVQLARQQAARAAPSDPARQEELFKRFLEWAGKQQQ